MTKKLIQSVENMKQFSERDNVNKVVVENFLSNLSLGNIPVTIETLVTDAKKNKWNNETIEAILDGILTYNGLEIDDLIYVDNLS